MKNLKSGQISLFIDKPTNYIGSNLIPKSPIKSISDLTYKLKL